MENVNYAQVCTMCKIIKPVKDFSKDTKRKPLLIAARCRSCIKEVNKNFYIKKREEEGKVPGKRGRPKTEIFILP